MRDDFDLWRDAAEAVQHLRLNSPWAREATPALPGRPRLRRPTAAATKWNGRKYRLDLRHPFTIVARCQQGSRGNGSANRPDNPASATRASNHFGQERGSGTGQIDGRPSQGSAAEWKAIRDPERNALDGRRVARVDQEARHLNQVDQRPTQRHITTGKQDQPSGFGQAKLCREPKRAVRRWWRGWRRHLLSAA
jgi:hypothetical protein